MGGRNNIGQAVGNQKITIHATDDYATVDPLTAKPRWARGLRAVTAGNVVINARGSRGRIEDDTNTAKGIDTVIEAMAIGEFIEIEFSHVRGADTDVGGLTGTAGMKVEAYF